MALPSPVCFDIQDFHKLDWYTASKHLGTLLAQKGFCFIKGSLQKEEKELIHKEVDELKLKNKLRPTPLEAVDAFFGQAASAWTYEVITASECAEEELPVDEGGLRVLDAFLDNVGYCVSASSTRYLQRAVRGRVRGILHDCRLPEDPEPPELMDPEEACQCASHCSSRKVVLLYYLGPSMAVASLCPRGDASKTYEVRIQEDTVIVYLNDACELFLQELGPGRIFEVNLMLQTKQSQQQAPKDVLSIPNALHEWFEIRLREIRSEAADGDALSDAPFSYIKQAHLSYLQGEPVKIVAQQCELPSRPRGDHIMTPLEGCLLGGLDTAAAIRAPPPKGSSSRNGLNDLEYFGAKWDLSEYYSEEGDVDNAKLYTKHLNVLYRSYDIAFDFDYTSFGITQEENVSLDHRCRMLCEAHKQILGQQPEQVRKKGSWCWGVYAGLTGQQQDLDVRINKHSWTNTSNAALVNRCSYGLNFNGPCLAIDTGDSSGLIASDMAVRALRQGACDAAVASSATWIGNPFGELLLLCAAGFISRSGRTRVFDASSDGYTKGEGAVAILLQPGHDLENKELREVTGVKALLAGTGINTKGQSSSLGSPSGHALQDVVSRALQDARFPAFVVDAVEANASGEALADQMELKVMDVFLRHKDDKAQSVVISSSKACFGQLGAPSGLVGLARFTILLEHGVHGPQIHLREMMDAQLDDMDDQQRALRMLFLTEATEARGYAQIYGVSSFGRSGSNCHQVILGEKPTPPQQPQFRSVQWWPGSKRAQKEAWRVLRGYYLVGTMTAWTDGLRMEEESEGVYGYTLTMGDNNWEKFQIWIDEDPDKVLHPKNPNDISESIIEGPSSDVSQVLCWKISGAKEEVRFVNEVQFQALEESGVSVQGPECLVAFGGSYVPPNTEDDIMKMPVVNLNAGLEGQPGDKYRIRLYIQGAYKRIEWTKAKGVDAVAPIGRRLFQHKFSVIGDHSHWLFEDMEEVKKGAYSIKVQILKSPSNFQIYRDRDFDQGFYPDEAGEILGPDDCGQGFHWKLEGEAGDIFEITFERMVRRKEDKKSIRWEHVANEPIDFEERAKDHNYYIAGSWNDFKDCKVMKKEVDENNVVSYKQEIIIGKSGTEAVQILLNRNWLAAVHPDRDHATQNDGHKIVGPDDGGAGKYWAIGADPEDDLTAGDHVIVHLEMKGGLPKRLWWEKYDSPNIHFEYLKAGSQRVFERHMRLMGLIPWQSKDQPARLANPPEWYGNGRDREDLKYTNLFVLTEEMLGAKKEANGNGALEDS